MTAIQVLGARDTGMHRADAKTRKEAAGAVTGTHRVVFAVRHAGRQAVNPRGEPGQPRHRGEGVGNGFLLQASRDEDLQISDDSIIRLLWRCSWRGWWRGRRRAGGAAWGLLLGGNCTGWRQAGGRRQRSGRRDGLLRGPGFAAECGWNRVLHRVGGVWDENVLVWSATRRQRQKENKRTVGATLWCLASCTAVATLCSLECASALAAGFTEVRIRRLSVRGTLPVRYKNDPETEAASSSPSTSQPDVKSSCPLSVPICDNASLCGPALVSQSGTAIASGPLET